MINLLHFGYHVLIIKEAATELKSKKIITGNESPYEFASAIVEYQLQREAKAENYAKCNSGRFIIISDRSSIEPAAYIGINNLSKILNKFGKTFEQTRDSYDIVVHVTTAAKGASEFYTLENNSARSENISEAIKIDDNLLSIWESHHNRHIVNNCNGFEEKLQIIESIVINSIYKEMIYDR